MSAPQYTAADYLGAMQALMPRGRVWPRDPDAVQTKVLAGLTKHYEVQNERSAQLLVDAFPATTLELLPEWEASLGLPSSAAGPAPSIAARQALVLARFVGAGGISTADFTGYALLLGFEITIAGHAPFRCGQSRCGGQLGDVERMFAWTVTARALASMPFGAYGQAVFESEFLRLAPPYAVLNFIFI